MSIVWDIVTKLLPHFAARVRDWVYYRFSKWKLSQRDFGIDQQGVRRVGFVVEEPQGQFEAMLEMFWMCGRKEIHDTFLFWHLNTTSRRLRKTPDGQFFLAIIWQHDPRYSLVMEDGYYGLFVLDGWYHARISVQDSNKRGKNCFDILIRLDPQNRITIEKIVQVRCNELPGGISSKDRVYDGEDWSTVKDFQPNLMYK